MFRRICKFTEIKFDVYISKYRYDVANGFRTDDENEKEGKSESLDKDGHIDEEFGHKFLDMYSSIYAMRQELDRIRKPIGSRENPARTCKDLFYGHPHFHDGQYSIYFHDTSNRIGGLRTHEIISITGWYWIDPNLGMADDAVYVYCNLTNMGETCVYPDIHTSQMPNIPWRKENNKTDWYSNLRGGFKVSPHRFREIII